MQRTGGHRKGDSVVRALLCIGLGGLVLLSGLAACKPPDDTQQAVWLDPDLHSVEAYGSIEGAHSIGRVVDAAISPSGRYLAILDFSEPFVHILDRQSRVSISFMRKGDGPGEIRFPVGLTFSADTLLAVHGAAGIDLLTVDGGVVGRTGSAEFRLRVQALTEGCGGKWFLYGRGQERTSRGEYPWLHRIDGQLGRATPVPVLHIPGRGSAGIGRLEGLDGSESAVFLWHRLDQAEAGWVYDCGADSSRLLVDRDDPVQVREVFGADGVGGQVLTLPDTLFSGVGLDQDTFLVAHYWMAAKREGQASRTWIRSWTPEGAGCVSLPGWWFLHDAGGGLVVLAAPEPYPRVVLVPVAALAGPGVLGKPCG